MTIADPIEDAVAYRAVEAHKAIGCTRRAIKQACSEGWLISRRIGRSTVILKSELLTFVESRPVARINHPHREA
jgi:hypothetical protein